MLSYAVDSYIALRRACGFQMQETNFYLQSFARFAADRGESHVRTQTAIEWAAQARTSWSREKRLRIACRFARHVRAEDGAHELPPTHVFASRKPPRPIPYIFSQNEIVQLVNAASKLGPHGSLRPWTCSTLFGLVAATGLRISEALALRLDDFTDDGLLIRESKFHKSRLIPIHETTITALQRYREMRCKGGFFDDHLFISLRKSRLRYHSAATAFCSLVARIGIQQRPGQRPPRLHSLRHTYAVRSLEACQPGRKNVTRHLLALSTYLGHARVADTYWYLQATPHLMADIADACQSFIEGASS